MLLRLQELDDTGRRAGQRGRDPECRQRIIQPLCRQIREQTAGGHALLTGLVNQVKELRNARPSRHARRKSLLAGLIGAGISFFVVDYAAEKRR